MADHYLQFSEVLPHLTDEEEQWLCKQLETVYVFGDQEYEEDGVPAHLDRADADWIGCRAYRDVPDCAEYVKNAGIEGPGFEYDFADNHEAPSGQQRHMWLGAEYGYVDGAAEFVRKFLKKFRPDQCWFLTYATTCSKLRVGEFGGGAVFVTADEIRSQNAYEFVEQERAAFEQNRRAIP